MRLVTKNKQLFCTLSCSCGLVYSVQSIGAESSSSSSSKSSTTQSDDTDAADASEMFAADASEMSDVIVDDDGADHDDVTLAVDDAYLATQTAAAALGVEFPKTLDGHSLWAEFYSPLNAAPYLRIKISCKNKHHKNCGKYRSISDSSQKLHDLAPLAYCLCWARASTRPGVSNRHDHISHKPKAEEVQAVLDEFSSSGIPV